MKNVIRVENGSMIFGQGSSGGSGGHTIQNDSGTALPQESALQFVGVYSEDDSTNGKTKVNIIREMTKAQMDALSTEAKKGVIHTTDEADNPANPISAADVSYGDGTVKDAFDKLSAKNYGTTVDLTSYTSTNQYTVPSDGHVCANCYGANYGIIAINGATILGAAQNVGTQLCFTTFVKKGMRLYTSGVTGTPSLKYYPFV